MRINRFTYLLVFSILIVLLSGAESMGQKDLRKAGELYSAGKYCEAIPLYSKHLNAYVDKNALVKRGRSYFHCNQLDEAIEDFENAKLLGYKKDNIEYFLAKTYHHQHEFEKAIKLYKRYLALNLKDDFIRKKITAEIKRCANGINLSYNKKKASVENPGPGVNSKNNEINMIQSPGDLNRFYFSKSGESKSSDYDIMVYSIRESEWLQAEYLNPNHQFYQEVIAAISKDGQQLFFSRFNEKSGSNVLLTDSFIPGDEPLSNIQKFEGPIRYELGDRDFFMINDSSFLFSSDRLGGYGGFDIFMTGYQDGYWFNPINLGPIINSTFDEITPSMDNQESKLYFSSDNNGSIGGFDIFSSSYSIKDQSWMPAKNLGFPINSAGNDFNYKVSGPSENALMTSDRKTDSYGAFDIFQVILSEHTDSTSLHKINDFIASQNLTNAYRRFGLRKIESKPVVIDSIKTDELAKTIPYPESEFEDDLIKLSEQSMESEDLVEKNIENRSVLLVKSLNTEKNKNILEPEIQLSYINSIIETMHENPGLVLKMTGHCSPGNSSWEDIEQTIERLLPIVKYLADEGVAPDHIMISGAGSTLPVAKNNVSDRLITASERYNNRIHFTFFKKENINIEYEAPFVVQHLRQDNWYLYRSVEEGLAYKILVDISNEQQFDQVRSYLSQCVAEMDIFTTKTNYFFGIFTKFNYANEVAMTISRETGLSTKVLPFVEEVPVDEENILDFAKDHTDLINYLESIN